LAKLQAQNDQHLEQRRERPEKPAHAPLESPTNGRDTRSEGCKWYTPFHGKANVETALDMQKPKEAREAPPSSNNAMEKAKSNRGSWALNLGPTLEQNLRKRRKGGLSRETGSVARRF